MKSKRLLFILCILVGLLGIRHSSLRKPHTALPAKGGFVPKEQKPDTIAGQPTPPREPTLSKESAIVCALNHITTEDDQTVRVKHPRHTAEFTTTGLTFTPARSEQAWKWSLRHFGTEAKNLISPDNRQVPAKTTGLRSVAYDYGLFTEIYHGKEQTLEQCFVLDEAPQLGNKNLVIRGEVLCDGQFESDEERRWQWRDLSKGAVVSLGNVTVFDAEGATIPATMSVSASSTEITVDGPLLAAASFPVTIDPEIGTDDFLISNAAIGGSMDAYSAESPGVCYNPDTNTYLFLWRGISEERTFEVKGQHVDAISGEPVGDVLRISQNGPSIVDTRVNGFWSLAAVYNATSQEYLVAWDHRTRIDGLGDYKIFAQRLDRLGNETGDDDFELTAGGFGRLPQIAFNPTSQRYAICWTQDSSGSVVRAQILNSTGGLEGQTAFEIAPTLIWTEGVDVAADASDGGFLFAFAGVATLDGNESVYTQKVNLDGGLMSLGLTLIADSGSEDGVYDRVAIARSSATDGYAVVWSIRNVEHGYNDPWLALLDNNGALASPPTKPGAIADSIDVAAAPDGSTYHVTWAGDSYDQASSYWTSFATLNASNGNVISSATSRPATYDNLYISALTAGGPTSQPSIALMEIREVPVPNVPERSVQELFATIIPLPHGNTPTLNWQQISQSHLIVDANMAAVRPDVAYDDSRDRYAVVWEISESHPGSAVWASIVYPDGTTNNTSKRVSQQGTEAEPRYATQPKIVFNRHEKEFMIAWAGTWDPTAPFDFEILAKRFVSRPIGPTRKLSNVPGDGRALRPRIAYNHDENEYLVAWVGNPDIDNKDIYGQLIDASGSAVGPNDFRISRSGADYLAGYNAFDFDIAYSSASEMYAVAYSAKDPFDDPFTGTIFERNGIFLQGLSRDGSLQNPFNQSVSTVADPEAVVSIAMRPGTNDEFLITWDGGADGERMISGQRVDGLRVDTMALLDDPFRISTPLTEQAFDPAVVYNQIKDEYMVSWTTNVLGVGSRVMARPIVADGGPYGDPMDLRSGSGFTTAAASLAHDAQGHYFSVWSGQQDRGYLADSSGEIFGQRFRTAIVEVTSIVIEGNDCILHIEHQPGSLYRVQTSTDLQNWINATEVLISEPSGENLFFDEGALFREAKFYRVEQPEI